MLKSWVLTSDQIAGCRAGQRARPLEVEDLMDALRARAGAAKRSHAQLEAPLDAVTAVSADLELSEVLGRIVRSACELVNARYGALGVLGPNGEHLMEFITHGVTPEERQAIGDLPRGHGILGLLIRDPRPRRLSDISALTQSLLESEGEDSALALMAQQVCPLTGAELCLLALRDEEAVPAVRAHHLLRDPEPGVANAADGWTALGGPHWEEILDAGQHLLLLPGSQGGSESRVMSDLASAGGLAAPGPTAVVPFSAGTGELGHLLVMWGGGQEDLAAQTTSDLSALAHQAALGLIAARAKHDRTLFAILEDRDRIARDLHDHVIQRLFATGLSLQACEKLAVHPVVRTRLAEAVDSMDVGHGAAHAGRGVRGDSPATQAAAQLRPVTPAREPEPPPTVPHAPKGAQPAR